MSLILALPGLGADATLFRAHWRALPGILCLSWPRDVVSASIPILLLWVTGELRRQFGTVPPVDAIIGVSLGGMVALELAPRIQCRG